MLAKAFHGPQLDARANRRRMPYEEPAVKAFIIANARAVAAAGAVFLCAGAASAQTGASAQDTAPVDQPTASAPLKLQVPDSQPWPQAGGADSPGVYYGDHGEDDDGVSVHGSFTTGVGYSKGYGTSTLNAAELHISKQYDDGKTVDMHINVEKTTGPGFSPYGYPYGGYYGPRYR